MEDDDTTLKSLLRSCASIRKRSRSWRSTLSSTTTERVDRRQQQQRGGSSVARNNPGGGYIRGMREEQQTAQILDRQILEYRAAIGRLKRRRRKGKEQQEASNATAAAATDAMANNSTRPDDPATRKKSTAKTTSQQHRLLHAKVMDSALRQQQESVLLSRMAMSPPAIQVATATTDNAIRDPTESLVQEGARCRNKLVKKALETQRTLDAVKQALRNATERGLELQKCNRGAWNKLQLVRQQQSHVSVFSSKQSSTTRDGPHMQRLATETVVLKRVLADILTGSEQLDWYKDQRLGETLLQLE